MKLVWTLFSYDRNSRYPVIQRRRGSSWGPTCLSHVATCYTTGRTSGSVLLLFLYIRLENIQSVHTVQYFLRRRLYVSQMFPNVEDHHDIPHSGISNSFKYFLTDDIDSIVDCNTRVIGHCVWKLCCHGNPVSSIKHLGGVQIFSITINASSDN